MVMDDRLPSSLLLEPPPETDLRELVAQLRSEVAVLRGDVARLHRDNRELRQQAGYWKALHAGAAERVEALRQDVEHLRGRNRQLRSDLFGRRSDKPTALDRSNRLNDPQDVKPLRKRGQQSQRPGPPRRDYSHLPVREEWV